MKATEKTCSEKSMRNDQGAVLARRKLLYVASTQSHLERFHRPYIEALRAEYDVKCMANGEGVDYPIPFAKSISSPSNFKAMLRIRKILKRERFDAVILNTSLAAFLCRMAMLGMSKRPRVLNIVHGYLFSTPSTLKDRLMLFCETVNRRRTDEIAVMNAEDAEIVKRYRLCKGKTHFIYGMGCIRPSAELQSEVDLRAALGVETSDLLLTFVGELSTRKNQSFLLRAVKRLRDEGNPIRLMLVGEGSMRETLEAEIASLQLQNAVSLVGSQASVLPYLSITDVYVSASRCEGLPFNLMEAMMCGLPIVASDIKGQKDLLANMPQSLYPLNDLDAFCKALTHVMSRKTGLYAYAYPQIEQYTLEAVFDYNLQLMKGFFDE